MDRHKIQSNRHKTKEVFKSGNAKRKIAKEKEKKKAEVLAKSRRMTDYIACNSHSQKVDDSNEVSTLKIIKHNSLVMSQAFKSFNPLLVS